MKPKKIDWLEKVVTACRFCGADVVVYVEPGAKIPIKICHLCRGGEAGVLRGDRRAGMYPELVDFNRGVSRLRDSIQAEDVKIYRPGDDDFDRIAAECTPIHQIRRKRLKGGFITAEQVR